VATSACAERRRLPFSGVKRSRHRYGERRWQVADLWLPDASGAASGTDAPGAASATAGPGPGGLAVVVLVHGGYWRSWYTKSLMNGLAKAVVAKGWAAWNIEYRRVGPLGGGGWPATLADVGSAVDHLRSFPSLDLSRVVTCGHSSGGHLALWAASRHRAPEGTPGTPPLVRPKAAMALAGVVDLVLGVEMGLGGGAVKAFLGGGPDQFPERYRAASPAALLPLGIEQVLVHGLADTVVPPEMSVSYRRAAVAAGDNAVYAPVPAAGHRELIDPTSAAWGVAAEHLERLLAPVAR
jgi:acetyl esterase/lipase